MADTVETVTEQELPIAEPFNIVKGDDFTSDIFQHLDADGLPIDTSGWTFPDAAIYLENACGAAKVIDLTIVHEPGPDFGYRAVLTAAQTAGLECACNFYKIPTFDGLTTKTYFDGSAKISGVG